MSFMYLFLYCDPSNYTCSTVRGTITSADESAVLFVLVSLKEKYPLMKYNVQNSAIRFLIFNVAKN